MSEANPWSVIQLVAERRIEEAQRQKDLFIHLPPAEDPADARMADLFREPEA